MSESRIAAKPARGAMPAQISILISTYNPDAERLRRTIDALFAQTLSGRDWELVLVDNASTVLPDRARIGLDRLANCKFVQEPRPGLTFGRLAGVSNSTAPIMTFVDDDNVLAADYLERALDIMHRTPRLGAGGGKSIAEWQDHPPEPWAAPFAQNLAIRDLGETELISAKGEELSYPHFAPIGAGMVVRREAIAPWIEAVTLGKALSDRKGDELSTNGDADIVLYMLEAGWSVGYFPCLSLDHLIPASRLTQDYLARHAYWLGKSWVQVLARHGILPWEPAAPWTVPLRKWRAHLRLRAWSGPAEYVRWKEFCGIFDGRAELGRRKL